MVQPSRKMKRVAHNGKANPAAAHQSFAELDAKRDAFQSQFAPYAPTLPPTARRKIGAPLVYRKEFADTFIELSALGHTAGAIAAVLGVSRKTINEWASEHSSSHAGFSEAYARGKGLRQFMYETHLIDIARRGGDSTRFAAVKLGLINVGDEDWKERLTADHNVNFSLGDLIRESMKLVDAPKVETIEGELVPPSRATPSEQEGD